jgi:hypothetical protein
MGELVYQEKFTLSSYKIKNNFKIIGYYFVKVVTKNGEATEKVYITKP